ncbi:MAG: heavy metal translocating P-type ATPase [Syntrophales bacterium]|nr:heavy metal translocating P-type ATPase [Syntrophales bacterium]
MAIFKCDHCLLTFPEKEVVYDEVEGGERTFCCNGCRGIFRLIHEEGFDEFYTKRKWDGPGNLSVLTSREIDIRPFIGHIRDVLSPESKATDKLKEIDMYIHGIRCASCIWLNEKILKRTEGVEYATVNYATHMAKVRWDPVVIGLEKILKRVLSIGYIPRPYSESEKFKAQKAESRDLLIRFGTAAFLSSQLMVYSMALYAGYFQGIDRETRLLLEIIAMALTVPVIFYSGMPFIRNTIRGLRRLYFNMDSLIAVGSVSAFAYSIWQMFRGGEVYFDTSSMIITLVLLGRYIETSAKGKAYRTIEMLAEMMPKEARLITGQGQEFMPLESVKKGALVQMKPGERVPLDGIVISGESEIDESIVTGESKPVLKTPGSPVIGGSTNLYGSIVFEVRSTGEETVFSKIIRAVEDAQLKKPRMQILADRIVGLFVPLLLLIAALTVTAYLSGGASPEAALMTGISVLVIACPCSLGLATPLAILTFTTLTSSKGVLIKGGEVIENVSKLTNVIFDKTGTITAGKPMLKEVLGTDGSMKNEELLSLAASIESLSEHSLGHAIADAAKGFGLRGVSAFKAVPGKGVEGKIEGRKIFIGNERFMTESGARFPDEYYLKKVMVSEDVGDTVMFMAWDGLIRAVFVVSDVIRAEAKGVVQDLRKMKLNVSIISGDNNLTTQSVAAAVGMEHAIAEASPVRKKEYIGDLQSRSCNVMMIGDGINDAPALMESTIGVAMGRGTDIAMESADVVLVRNDLRLIPYFLRVSGKVYAVIRQNIFWAFFYNVVAIPLAVAGMLHPIVAASAMAASSLFVVGNSLRIRRMV